MVGHEKLWEMRKQGLLPISLFVDESKVCSDWFNPGEKYGEVWESDLPHVCILPEEPVGLLDLRFSVGMTVHIASTSEKRAKELLEAFKGAGASLVAAQSFKPVVGKDYFETEYLEIWHKS